MRLSEAIRLGAMLKPKCTGRLWRDGGSCALGAAADAIGLVADDVSRDGVATIWTASWPSEWVTLFQTPVLSPVRGGGYLRNVLEDLNDGHRWSREQIADWVETIERQHEQPQQEPAALALVTAA